VSDLPKISVITPSFNSIHTIRNTIESVRSQAYQNWEHIVIDGASTDGTVDLLKQYPHLSWLSEKDEGHYHAMNKGIQRATGDIVYILNSDDCVRPGVFQMVAEAFREHPEWDALFGDARFVDDNGTFIFSRREACYDYNVLRYIRFCYIIHQALFVRKAVHDQIGLYRHKDFLNGCDYEFILRLGKSGYKVGHLPFYLVDYRFHEHGQSADLRVKRNMYREAGIICREYGRPDGMLGRVYRTLYRLKRQLQKLFYRGVVDLMPGSWILRFRKQLKERTSFTSNIDIGKLRDKD